MRIVIKPLGAFVLVGAIGALAVLAFRNAANGAPGAVAPPATAAVASGLASAAPPPLAPAPNPSRGHAIYRDGLENGWQSEGWTWAKDVKYDDTTRVRSGSRSIRVRYREFDGVKFHHGPLDTRPFDRVSFYVHGGAEGGQRLQVGGTCSEKEGVAGVHLDPLPPGEWVAVTVPLKDLRLDGKPDMTSFWIQGGSDKPQPTVHIDEVRLLLPTEPAPAGRRLDYRTL